MYFKKGAEKRGGGRLRPKQKAGSQSWQHWPCSSGFKVTKDTRVIEFWNLPFSKFKEGWCSRQVPAWRSWDVNPWSYESKIWTALETPECHRCWSHGLPGSTAHREYKTAQERGKSVLQSTQLEGQSQNPLTTAMEWWDSWRLFCWLSVLFWSIIFSLCPHFSLLEW